MELTPPCNIVVNREDPSPPSWGPHARLRNIWTAPYQWNQCIISVIIAKSCSHNVTFIFIMPMVEILMISFILLLICSFVSSWQMDFEIGERMWKLNLAIKVSEYQPPLSLPKYQQINPADGILKNFTYICHCSSSIPLDGGLLARIWGSQT